MTFQVSGLLNAVLENGNLLTSTFVCVCVCADLMLSHLKWMNNEDSDSLLVGTKTPNGCFIELFALVEKATPIHSYFKHAFQQPNKTDVFKSIVSIAGK